MITNASELINALQDHLVLEGDRSEGQAAIFKKERDGWKGSESHRDSRGPLTCFKCGKVGHKAIDCWTGKGGSAAPKVMNNLTGGVVKIVCYTSQQFELMSREAFRHTPKLISGLGNALGNRQ